MSDQRDGGISWTDETWNPVRGCSRVSEGCRNCYAEKVAGRFSGPGLPYDGLVTIGEKGPRWNGTVRLVPEHLSDPLRWRRPRRVFVNSMSDLFHESLPFETIAAVFGVMAGSPKHTFQVLTKRPQRAKAFFEWVAEEGEEILAAVNEKPPGGSPCPFVCWAYIGRAYTPERDVLEPGVDAFRAASVAPWPLPNVWLGVSVEDQATADSRIPLLLECPAAVRWVSYEPALGPVDFRALPFGPKEPRSRILDALTAGSKSETPWHLDWVVVGGESGPGARPFDLAWARSVIEQCRAAGVPVFFKQGGSNPVSGGACLRLTDRKGGDLSELPTDINVREWPDGVR